MGFRCHCAEFWIVRSGFDPQGVHARRASGDGSFPCVRKADCYGKEERRDGEPPGAAPDTNQRIPGIPGRAQQQLNATAAVGNPLGGKYGAGTGSRIPKTRRSADFESEAGLLATLTISIVSAAYIQTVRWPRAVR